MNENERSITEDVKVDRFSLEINCEEQPSLMYHWGEKLADAKKTRDKLKNKLDLTIAESQLHIRNNPPDGIKITEAVIDALVTKNTTVQELEKQLVDAEHDIAVLESAFRAIQDRRSELDNLVKLWIAGYYADPNRGSKTDALEDKQRQALKKRQGENE